MSSVASGWACPDAARLPLNFRLRAQARPTDISRRPALRDVRGRVAQGHARTSNQQHCDVDPQDGQCPEGLRAIANARGDAEIGGRGNRREGDWIANSRARPCLEREDRRNPGREGHDRRGDVDRRKPGEEPRPGPANGRGVGAGLAEEVGPHELESGRCPTDGPIDSIRSTMTSSEGSPSRLTRSMAWSTASSTRSAVTNALPDAPLPLTIT